MLPVVQSSNSSNYCNFLASLFDISQPLCYEYESLKENPARIFCKTLDEEKTEEDILREQYEQSKMGYLEEKLKNAQLERLPYIVIGCPTEGITLDHTGTTVSIDVRSSGPFTIE